MNPPQSLFTSLIMKSEYPNIEVKNFPAEVIEALRESNDKLIEAEASRSELAARIIASQKEYLAKSRTWTRIGDFSFISSVAK